ncbi:sigma-70 family RNA polymerase sigma factor [Acinetobacter larvae]|uniref:RNA polymerase subunit sigma n=1 Tax=Acinetobacter larvae TaxID=1789224 RepID=A0A1B2LYA9_9GAMM|nr:sigma-70 family RNA polymerase sigma factor [Acinetobacter larvae]AOA57763.1 hypothetical protein BFG52_04915 [Acinetobacter larvae]
MTALSASHLIATLYKDNHHWLYHWLCKTMGSQDHAEDVLQDTFVKIMRSKDIFSIQKPQNYIYATAKRIIIDQARRKKIEQAYLCYLAQFEEDWRHPSPEETLMAIEILDQMAFILSDLDERPRSILLMHYIDEIPQTEIALQLNISTKTVQRDLIKALLHCHHHSQ